MSKRSVLSGAAFLAAFLLVGVDSAEAYRQSSLNTGPPINLHRRHVVNQAKKKAARGEPVRRHAGVWLSGGFDRTVSKARSGRSSGYRASSYRRWGRR